MNILKTIGQALAAICFMTLGLCAFIVLGTVDLIFRTDYVKKMIQAGKENDGE